MSKLITILNGPNLNLLGKREPEIYGHDTLDDVEAACAKVGKDFGLAVKLLQSNWEGQIVDWIHDARQEAAGIISRFTSARFTSARRSAIIPMSRCAPMA